MTAALRPVDADDHDCERLDTFTRYQAPRMRDRGVEVVRPNECRRISVMIGGPAILRDDVLELPVSERVAS